MPSLTRQRRPSSVRGSMQRNLLIGVIVIVLIERARMRPGG
jgi:hypothetical protein